MRRLYKIFIFTLFFVNHLTAQLTTTQTLTPQQLVQNVLLGSGVTASNITFTGNLSQIGQFSATANTNLGLTAGILISSGHASTSSINGPQGPNNNTGTTTSFNNAGDPDLNIISGNNTYDAGILQFDFIPTGDSLKFRYFFGSEEYPEFVNSSFNDAFGFFLTGPNPSGGTFTNKNIALIPGTTTGVSINNVNASTNNTFYRSNTGNIINCEFDGLTKVMYALENVICGQTYHIKIAIADGGLAPFGDYTYDSGVFLEASSFSSLPPLALNSTNPNSNVPDSILSEDCNINCFNFIRNGNTSLADSFNLQISGNAILGTDYIQVGNPGFTWPNKVVFAANQDTVKFCNLSALQDNSPEGIDTIKISLSSFVTSTTSCLSSNAINFNLYIKDYTPITIAQNDITLCAGQSTILNASASFGYPAYSYTINPSSVNTPTLNTGPVTSIIVYTITVNDVCDKPVSKEITVTPVANPTVVATNTMSCGTGSVYVSASGASTYTWSTGVVSDSLLVNPSTQTNYTVIGANGACTNSAVSTVSVVGQTSISGNNLLCIGESSTLTASSFGSSYLWNTGESTTSIVVTPTTNTTYTVASIVGSCTNIAVYTVSVTSTPTLTFAAPIICPGQNAVISAFGATTYTWSTGIVSNSITVNPSVPTTYTVTGTLNTSCTNTAVYTLTVVPTPTLIATDTVICFGDNALLGVTGANSYSWNTGAISHTISVNPAISTDYTVTGSVGSCTSMAVATVSVINQFVSITGNNHICAGQSTTLTALGGSSLLWSNGQTINPIVVSPNDTTTYMVTSTLGACSVNSVKTVSVVPNPTISVVGTSICPGQTGIITASGASTYTWNTGAITNSINVNSNSNTTYTVIGSSSPSCKDTSIYTVNLITSQPVITPISPVVMCLDSIKQVSVMVTDGNPPYNINWLIPNNGITPYDTLNNVYYFLEYRIPGVENYTVTVSDQCAFKDTIVLIIEIIDCNVVIPNVITANGDGINDYFIINGLQNYSGSILSVFNRWGKRIYTNSDYKNDWSPDENNGTYFYTLNLTDGRKFNGFFQLFKD
ncbi:MAG: choice-of-anchor L domain-containing protein [Bacteroidota bacterium]